MLTKISEICSNLNGARVTTEQLFGIEFEAENVPGTFGEDTNEALAHWRITEDGSLRNNGAEFVTEPIDLRAAKEAIDEFYLVKEKFGFLSSIRTSMHVHADMRNDTYKELGGVLGAYLLLEPLLFLLCSEEREENIYCIPFYRTCTAVDHIREILLKHRNLWNQINKYSALNLGSLRTFGTIEFRQAPLWTTAGAAKVWISIIDELVRTGRTYDSDSFIKALSNDGASTAIRLALPTMHEVLLDVGYNYTGGMTSTLTDWLLDHDIAANTMCIQGREKEAKENFKWKFLNMRLSKCLLEASQTVEGMEESRLVQRLRAATRYALRGSNGRDGPAIYWNPELAAPAQSISLDEQFLEEDEESYSDDDNYEIEEEEEEEERVRIIEDETL